MLKVLLFTSLFSVSLFAAEEVVKVANPVYQEAGSNSVGLSLGVAKLTGSNIQQIPVHFSYGFEFNHAYVQELAVGVFISRNEGKLYNTDTTVAVTKVGLQVLYSPVYDAIISLKAGFASLSASKDVAGVKVTAQEDSSPFFVAPGLGIVFPITQQVQFVPSISYTFVLKNDDTASFQIFDTVGTIRYLF